MRRSREEGEMMALVLPGNQVPELRLKRLTDQELFVLCETLGHFPDAPFVYLDLSFNQISDAGARAIMILLSVWVLPLANIPSCSAASL
jgi:hypothetical protein